MQEVKTIIAMPKFDSKKTSFTTEGDYTKVAINHEVVAGLREYVATISTLYRDNNPFHNFEVCHVGTVARLQPVRTQPCLKPSDSRSLHNFKACLVSFQRIVSN